MTKSPLSGGLLFFDTVWCCSVALDEYMVCGYCGLAKQEHVGPSLQCVFSPTQFRAQTKEEYVAAVEAQLCAWLDGHPNDPYIRAEVRRARKALENLELELV